jgi:hypothetical protein
VIYDIIRHPCLSLESEDCLYIFVRHGNETNPEFFAFMESVRFECCAPDTISDFFELLSAHIDEFNRSMWAAVSARVVLSGNVSRQFPPSVKRMKDKGLWGNVAELDVPDGIIAHLTRECGGNVHDRAVVEVTSSSVYCNDPRFAGGRAADLEEDSHFASRIHWGSGFVVHTRNNWLCYDFKERRIAPTHYTIRSNFGDRGGWHLKSWVVETSEDGNNWREVDHQEGSDELNGSHSARTFAVEPVGGPCRFIRLVNTDMNHSGNNSLDIEAWEIFGGLAE